MVMGFTCRSASWFEVSRGASRSDDSHMSVEQAFSVSFAIHSFPSSWLAAVGLILY